MNGPYFEIPQRFSDALYLLTGKTKDTETANSRLGIQIRSASSYAMDSLKRLADGGVNDPSVNIKLNCPPLEFIIHCTTYLGSGEHALNDACSGMSSEALANNLQLLQGPVPPIRWTIYCSGYAAVFVRGGLTLATNGTRLVLNKVIAQPAAGWKTPFDAGPTAQIIMVKYQAITINTLDHLADLRTEYLDMAVKRFIKLVQAKIETGEAWQEVNQFETPPAW